MSMQMTPIDWAKRPLSRYADFSGRAPRAEYWWFYLAYLIAYLVASIVDSLLGFPALSILLLLGLLVPFLAVAVRRLHDTDRTGWWLLGPLVLYGIGLAIGGAAFLNPASAGAASLGAAGIFLLLGGILAFVLFIFTLLPGTRGSNTYGPDPYENVSGEPGIAPDVARR